MISPLISIIVPVYMVEDYIKECLDSIVNQTYKNFEVILINDGTKDLSGEIAKQYTRDKRFIYFEKKNEGISAVRNMGLKLAKGDYICFVDSDDYVDRDYLSNLVKNIGDADVALCYYRLLNIDGSVKEPKEMIETIINPLSIWDVKTITGRMIDVPWNKLYKANVIKNLVYPFGKIHEDSLVINNLLMNCNKIQIVGKCLYSYRQREGSIMSIARATNSLERFNVYFSKIDYFLSIKRFNLASESYLALACDYSTIRKNKQNKEELNTILKNARITGKKITKNDIKFKRKIFINLFIFSPFLFRFFSWFKKKNQ